MNKTKKAWKRFIENDYIDTSIVRPIIADSWKRCKLAGVDPYSKRPIGTLNNKEIKALLERNKHLIEVSWPIPVSYTHLRAHETRHDIVCRLLLEKKKKNKKKQVL